MSIAIDERREYSRFNREQVVCNVTINNRTQSGFVVEESIGGLRVSGLHFENLRLNEPISVVFEDNRVEGYCRNLEFDESGKYSVGLLCCDGSTKLQLGGNLLACFLKHKDKSFVCTKLEEKAANVHIRLIDGKDFVLSKELVEIKTRRARASELMNESPYLYLLCQLYKITIDDRALEHRELVDRILEFEFSSLDRLGS